jgi:hypothetical protein
MKIRVRPGPILRLRYVILFIIIIFGFLAAKRVIITGISSKVVNAPVNSINQPYDLRVIKAVNVLKHGEIGTITIQGKPGTKYTIIANYSKGDKDFIAEQQQRSADEFGQATFIWTVAKETAPGTYLVTITGGGKTINLHHTVIE